MRLTLPNQIINPRIDSQTATQVDTTPANVVVVPSRSWFSPPGPRHRCLTVMHRPGYHLHFQSQFTRLFVCDRDRTEEATRGPVLAPCWCNPMLSCMVTLRADVQLHGLGLSLSFLGSWFTLPFPHVGFTVPSCRFGSLSKLSCLMDIWTEKLYWLCH